MTTYSAEYKASIIAKMLPPISANVPDLAKETRIPKDTLYCWRSKASKDAEGVAVTSTSSGELSSEEKFAIVVETASLNETELSEYCRHRGLYPQQMVSSKRERAKLREHKQQIKALQRELRHSVRSSWSPRTENHAGATTRGQRFDRRSLCGRGKPGASLPGGRVVGSHPPALARTGRHQGRRTRWNRSTTRAGQPND